MIVTEAVGLRVGVGDGDGVDDVGVGVGDGDGVDDIGVALETVLVNKYIISPTATSVIIITTIFLCSIRHSHLKSNIKSFKYSEG